MGIASAQYHQQNFALVNALGEKRNAGTFSMVPDDLSLAAAYLIIKQFPVPVISGGDAIDVALPGGGKTYQQGPMDTSFTGAIMLTETVGDSARNFLRQIIAGGGTFDATIYDGTPERHKGGWKIKKAFIKIDAFDADWENKTALMNLNGTIWFNFFDETVPPIVID